MLSESVKKGKSSVWLVLICLIRNHDEVEGVNDIVFYMEKDITVTALTE